jgi:hypothetical protein
MIDPIDENPDFRLALAYSTTRSRTVDTVLMRFDSTLQRLTESSREPALAQIKLRWWGDQLDAMTSDTASAAHPLLSEMKAAELGKEALRASSLLIEAWEMTLIRGPEMVEQHARARGDALFCAAALASVPESAAHARQVGQGWGLARAIGLDPVLKESARAQFSAYGPSDLPKPLRAWRILASLAQSDLISDRKIVSPGSPRRMLRAARLAFFSR